MNKKILVSFALVFLAFAILPICSANQFWVQGDKGIIIVNFKDTSNNLFSQLFVSFQYKTQFLINEQVDIIDSYSRIGGTCLAPDYWKIDIYKDGTLWDTTGDINEFAYGYGGGCNFEVTASFTSDEPGTYSLKSYYKLPGSSTTYTSDSPVSAEILSELPTNCEYEGWTTWQVITGGKQEKNLNTCPNDYDTQYRTICTSGYHIIGTTSDTSAQYPTNCISDSGSGGDGGTDGTGTCLSGGNSCAFDSDCCSGTCKWVLGIPPRQCAESGPGTGGTGIGNESLKVQIGINAEDIYGMTSNDLLKSSCTSTEQCKEGSNCKSYQYLVSEGYLTEEKANSLITSSSVFLTSVGGVGGIAACSAILAAPTLGTSIPLCAVAGGALGYAINDWWNAFSTKDKSKAGYCILDESSSSFCQYTSWAALFPITKNKCNDGLIIILGFIILTLMIFKRR